MSFQQEKNGNWIELEMKVPVQLWKTLEWNSVHIEVNGNILTEYGYKFGPTEIKECSLYGI